MSYVYSRVDALQRHQKVSTRQCVALIQWYTRAPKAALWHEGAKVRGNLALAKGTAIATFVNGRYPNLPHGNHAAFYLRQDSTGIWVMDQWADDTRKPWISSRPIKFCSPDGCRPGTLLSDDGNAYSVIE